MDIAPTELDSKLIVSLEDSLLTVSIAPLHVAPYIIDETITLDLSSEEPLAVAADAETVVDIKVKQEPVDLEQSFEGVLVLDDLRSPPKKKPFKMVPKKNQTEDQPAANGDSNVVAVNRSVTLSNVVLATKVAEDFIAPHLLRYLNLEAIKMGVVPKGKVAITECMNAPEMNGAQLTFESVETASYFCTIAELLAIEYEGENLQFKQMPAAKSNFVKFSGLPSDFIEPHFVRRFLCKLPGNDASSVKRVVKTLPPNVIILEFSSVESAQHTCCIVNEGKEYEGSQISGEMVPLEKISNNSPPNTGHLITDNATSKSGPLNTCEASSSQNRSDYEKQLLFVKAFVRLRRMFSGRNHDTAFATLYNDLSNIGIDWDIPTLKKKRKNLVDSYKSKSKNGTLSKWEFAAPLAVIQGDADESTLQNTDFAPNGDDEATFTSDLKKFCKGAVWTHKAICSLITVATEKKGMWEDDSTTNDSFYSKVSEILENKYNHYYEPGSCENKLSKLKCEYRNEAKRLGKTGESAEIEFPYFNHMYDLMAHDHTVNPKRVLTVGAAPLTITEANSRASKGVSRPTALKRPPSSIKERKTVALETIAEVVLKKYSP